MAVQSFSNNNNLVQNKLPDRRQILGILSLTLTASLVPTLINSNSKLIENNNISLESVIKHALNTTVLIKTENGEGSGVIIYDPGSDRNFILTAKHVVKCDCNVKRDEVGNVLAIEANGRFDYNKPIEIKFNKENQSYLALVRNRPNYCENIARIIPDEPYCLSGLPDLCLLECKDKIAREVTHFRNLISEPLIEGERLFTIGHPGSEYFKISELSVINPKIKDPNIDLFQEYIQLKGNVNPGNSGGAIFDTLGRIVGIVTKHSIIYPDIGYGIANKFIIDKLSHWGLPVSFD
jgi:hypothetical protein